MSATEENVGIAQTTSGESRPTYGLQDRELDALVAVKVMGWLECTDTLHPTDNRQIGTKAYCHPDFQSTEKEAAYPVPYYSRDIAAAWSVVERCGLSVVQSEDGWYAQKPTDIQHSSLRGTAYPTITLVYEEGAYPEASATAPLAICLAALKVTP